MAINHPKSAFIPLVPDAQRELANLEQAYNVLSDAQRELRAMPSSMYEVMRDERAYLYCKLEPADSGTSLGRLDEQAASRLAQYRESKEVLRERIATINPIVEARARTSRALRVPALPDQQGELLRELDYAQLLGTDLMLVGTNCFPAYEALCGVRFPVGSEATEDFDLAWCRGTAVSLASAASVSPGNTFAVEAENEGPRRARPTLLSVLRSIDTSYRINRKKPYQAVNNASYEVELMAAPSRMPLPANTGFAPMDSLVEQEWLLQGRPFSSVLPTARYKACPLFVPDPRWMALHKLWLGRKPKRNPNKRPKDLRQGNVLLDACRYFLADAYPMDLDFVRDLPEELRDLFHDWAEQSGFDPTNLARGFEFDQSAGRSLPS